MLRHKVLIIKTGYSEFLDNKTEVRRVSLGDVLRTTPLLHLYKNEEVTWITDLEAMPLLKRNPHIDRLIPLDFTYAMQLLEESFDTLINLEKNPDICKFSGKIDAWKKYGFRFDKKTNMAEAYDRASEVLAVSSNPDAKKINKKTTQKLLFEMVGQTWKDEEYILGYSPKTNEKYDIGLNVLVGQKWPTKAWSNQNWDKLEIRLKKEGFKVTRQNKQSKEVLKNLEKYIDWINSCNVIISNDSLGLHLGIALKKRTLGLFGPTPHLEIEFYGRGQALLPNPYPSCAPCFKEFCENEGDCINQISINDVHNKLLEYIEKPLI